MALKGDLGPTDGTSPAIFTPEAMSTGQGTKRDWPGEVKQEQCCHDLSQAHISPCPDARAGVMYTARHRNTLPGRAPWASNHLNLDLTLKNPGLLIRHQSRKVAGSDR